MLLVGAVVSMTRADLTLPTPVPLLFHAEGSITNSQDEVSLRKKNGKGGVKSTPGQVLINSFLFNKLHTLRYNDLEISRNFKIFSYPCNNRPKRVKNCLLNVNLSAQSLHLGYRLYNVIDSTFRKNM